MGTKHSKHSEQEQWSGDKTSTLPASFRRRGGQETVTKTGSLPRNAGGSNFERSTAGAAGVNNSLGQKIRKSCRNWAVQKGLVQKSSKSGTKKDIPEEPKTCESSILEDETVAAVEHVEEKELDIGAIVASLVVEAHKKKMASRAQSRAQSREALLESVTVSCEENNNRKELTKEVSGEEREDISHRSGDEDDNKEEETDDVDTESIETSQNKHETDEQTPDTSDQNTDNLIEREASKDENDEVEQIIDDQHDNLDLAEEKCEAQQNAELEHHNEEEESDKRIDEIESENVNDVDKRLESLNTSPDQISNKSNTECTTEAAVEESIETNDDDELATSDPEVTKNEEENVENVAEIIVDEIVDTVTETDLMDKSKQVVIDSGEIVGADDKLER